MGKACQRQRVGRDRSPRRLISWLLPGGASEFTNARFAKPLGGSLTRPIGFLVFETTLREKTVYCCLPGGHLDSEGEV